MIEVKGMCHFLKGVSFYFIKIFNIRIQRFLLPLGYPRKINFV